MQYEEIINNLLSDKWYYIDDKKLLVLFLGDTLSLKNKSLLNSEGYLNLDFKQEITACLKSKGLLDGTVGPFGDDDYFSGINEDDKTNYFFEIHQVTPELLEKFKKNYSIAPTIKA